jgi:cyclophilin family peptidyl-prolyl cis-trans isomerase
MKVYSKIVSVFTLFFVVANLSCTQSLSTNQVIIETSLGVIKISLYEDTPEHTNNFIKLVEDGFYNELLFHRVIDNFMIQGGDPDSKNAPTGKQLGNGGPGYTIQAEFKNHYFHKKGALAAARLPDQMNPEKRSSGSQFYIVKGKIYTEEELTTDSRKLQEYFGKYINEPGNEELKNQVVQLQRQRRFADIQNLLKQYKSVLESFYDISFYKPYPEDRLAAYTSVGGTPHLDDAYTVFGEVTEGLDIIDKIAAVSTDPNNRPLEDIKFTIKLAK